MAPGAPGTTPKGGALRAPPFGVVSGAIGPVQTPKIYHFWIPETWVFMIILIRSWGICLGYVGQGYTWVHDIQGSRPLPGAMSRARGFAQVASD